MENIINYYENYNEDIRLDRDNAHRTEFITTAYILDSVMKPGMKILDVGAGTGKYSFHYANKGYSVTSVDLSPKNVNIMLEKSKRYQLDNNITINLGNALDLDFIEDESFDMVLCMGPIYHLRHQEERIKAIETSMKKLKKGGILAVSYINKFAVIVSEIRRDNQKLFGDAIDNILSRGEEFGDDRDNFFSTSPDEIEQLMKNFSIEQIENVGTDGIGSLMASFVNSLSDEEYAKWLDYHLKTCREKSISGYSIHGLYVGRKNS